MNKAERLPVIYIPHGGGPWPLMKDAFGDPEPFDRLEAYLRDLGKSFKDRIKSILVISAHWEERIPTIHFGKKPGMLYDYGGFPDFTLSYQLAGAGRSRPRRPRSRSPLRRRHRGGPRGGERLRPRHIRAADARLSGGRCPRSPALPGLRSRSCEAFRDREGPRAPARRGGPHNRKRNELS